MPSQETRRRFRAADEIAQLEGLADLIEHVWELATSQADIAPPSVQTVAEAREIVCSGYDLLPAVYVGEYLNGLRELIETYDYDDIKAGFDRDGEGPWQDWMAAIAQRDPDERLPETNAFEEVIRDLYDGFLSLEQRLGVKPPQHETVAPLVKWGAPEAGPYTWPPYWSEFGIRCSVVSMPPDYRKNVALWAALGHECAGHDILRADDGLLEELQEKVRRALLDEAPPGTVKHYGSDVSLAEFAAEYWSNRIDETASDIAGLLNLGPAAAVGIAALFIPFGNGVLSAYTTTDDPHPIDVTRMWLAAELMANLRNLDADRKDAWVNRIDRITDEYGEPGDLELWMRISGDWQKTTEIPRDQFRETARIVAKTIAFGKMDSLEGRSLADINTWTTMDEAIADSVAQDLAAGNDVELQTEPTTYAAHVLSGAVLAMAEAGADIPTVQDLTIDALQGLYGRSPDWGPMPARMPRDPARHLTFDAVRRGSRPRKVRRPDRHPRPDSIGKQEPSRVG